MRLFRASNATVLARLDEIEWKLDAIIAALGIQTPPRLTPGERAGMTREQIDEVRALIHAGRKIEAIKRVREFTGMGLKESKDLVDAGP